MKRLVLTAVIVIGATTIVAPATTASLAPGPAPRPRAQEPTSWPALVLAFEGEWEGRGTLFGNAATFTMQWTRVLDGRFLHLRFTNALVTEDGTSPVISAEAFYRVEEGARLAGHWFDTRGLIVMLSAGVEDDRLVTDWAAPGVESGRTTYRLVDPDTVEVIDEVQSEQGLQEFGRATYTRRR